MCVCWLGVVVVVVVASPAMSVLGILSTFWATLYENPKLYLVITAGTIFLTYYFREVAKCPSLICREGKFRSFLLQHCSLLHETFRPTLWYFESRLQTVLASCFRSRLSKLQYRREVLNLSDGAQVHLDWIDNESSKYGDPLKRPTVLFLPGLTGDSHADYLRTLVVEAKNAGLRSVIFNNRGKGGTTLRSARTYCACICSDLVEVINHIKSLFPEAPLMGTGISLGGIILSHHLAQAGANCKLVAAMVISIVWNVFEGTKSLETPILNLMLNNHLAKSLINSIKDYPELFNCCRNLNWDKIMSAKTIKEFDTEYTSKIFGFNNIDDYYESSCLVDKLAGIKTPLLAINAADDPFQPFSSIPVKEIMDNQHIAVVVTSRGGHIGFLDGIFPSARGFMDRLFSQYVSVIFENFEEFKKLMWEMRNEEPSCPINAMHSKSSPQKELLDDVLPHDKEKDLPQEITNSIQKSAHSLLQ